MASDEQKRSGEIDEKTTSQPEPSATAEPHAQSQKFWRTFLKKMAIAVGLFWKELYRLRLNRLDLARAERRLGEKAYATGTADGQPGLVSRLDQVTGRVAHLRQQKSDVRFLRLAGDVHAKAGRHAGDLLVGPLAEIVDHGQLLRMAAGVGEERFEEHGVFIAKARQGCERRRRTQKSEVRSQKQDPSP